MVAAGADQHGRDGRQRTHRDEGGVVTSRREEEPHPLPPEARVEQVGETGDDGGRGQGARQLSPLPASGKPQQPFAPGVILVSRAKVHSCVAAAGRAPPYGCAARSANQYACAAKPAYPPGRNRLRSPMQVINPKAHRPRKGLRDKARRTSGRESAASRARRTREYRPDSAIPPL